MVTSNATASSSAPFSHRSETKRRRPESPPPPPAALPSRKGKQRASPFEERLSRIRLPIAPKFSLNHLVGVKEKLDGMIMRYVLASEAPSWKILIVIQVCAADGGCAACALGA